MKTMLGMLLTWMFAGTAAADSLWTYTGNTMTGCHCALDDSLTLDSTGSAIA